MSQPKITPDIPTVTLPAGAVSHTPRPATHPDHRGDQHEPADPVRQHQEPEDHERQGVRDEVGPPAVQQRCPHDAVEAVDAARDDAVLRRAARPSAGRRTRRPTARAVNERIVASACSGRAGKTRAAGAMATTLPTSGTAPVRSRRGHEPLVRALYHRRGEHRHHGSRPGRDGESAGGHARHRVRPRASDTEARIAAHPGRPPPPAARRPRRGARWRTVDEQLAALAAAVEALRTHATTPAELREALVLPFAEAREGAAEAVRLLRVLEARLARDTVNIGVSGQARVGKSTLLQSVSGLGDDQIPTGPGAAGHRRPQPDLPRPGPAPRHAAAALVRHVRHRRRRALPRRAGHRGPAGDPGRVPALGLPQAFATARLAGFRRRRRSRRGASPDGRARRRHRRTAPAGSRC